MEDVVDYRASSSLDYKPRFPADYRPGIGIIGCGGIVKGAHLPGAWFPDGFAGAMGELLCAIAEDREPYNAAAHNLLSLHLTLEACRSADMDGQLVQL